MNSTMALALVVVTLCPAYLHASSAKPAMEVVVLGSGGPRPFGRAGSSYILVLGQAADLGGCRTGSVLAHRGIGSGFRKVDTVLLTHLHIDHSGDLAAFFNARALTSDGPIAYRIFGPDGAGAFPKTSRFVDLLVGRRARLRIKRRLARTNRSWSAIWPSIWIQFPPGFWMRMA